ncbi:MAG: NAD(+)/NADH kinase [Pirellulales bacterium]
MSTLDPAASQPPGWCNRSELPKVALIGSGDRPHVLEEAERLKAELPKHVDLVHTDFEWNTDLSQLEIDFAIVLGGDGSILQAARSMGSRQVPVIGVNMGKLGFLAEFSPSQLLDVIASICAGECQVLEHMMLHCRVYEGEKLIGERTGLNEAAVLGGPPYQIQNIDLYVDSELATTYSCDGLIISTPVGSTAHNLSAGGPILRSNLQAFVISPISPHTLTVRPVVDTAERVFEIQVQGTHENSSLVVDGQTLCTLTEQRRVVIDRATSSFQLITVAGHNYYRTLREKLGWGGRITKD